MGVGWEEIEMISIVCMVQNDVWQEHEELL